MLPAKKTLSHEKNGSSTLPKRREAACLEIQSLLDKPCVGITIIGEFCTKSLDLLFPLQ
jgi:hypothetical protein